MVAFDFEGPFVTAVIGELSLDGAVIERLGGVVAADFVLCVESSQVNPTEVNWRRTGATTQTR
jgi:hypothetical protein